MYIEINKGEIIHLFKKENNVHVFVCYYVRGKKERRKFFILEQKMFLPLVD